MPNWDRDGEYVGPSTRNREKRRPMTDEKRVEKIREQLERRIAIAREQRDQRTQDGRPAPRVPIAPELIDAIAYVLATKEKKDKTDD